MHSEALQWLDACRARLSVCDLGSYVVNGSARDHFHGWDYVGVDIRPGPGVTVVADAAEFDADGRMFDVVVSCEMLEHTPRAAEIVRNAFRLTKPGGSFWGTCAGPGRPEHSSDGAELAGQYYGNVEPNQIKAWLTESGFEQIIVDQSGHDVRWWSRRPVE
jgi:SAM-dependent methyltransferase